MGRWVEEEHKLLEKGVASGLTNDEITEQLPKRTKAAVVCAISEFGLQRNPKVVSTMRSKGNWKGGKAATGARYRASHKEKRAEYQEYYRENNPERFKAINTANYAVRIGRLKIQPCEWINDNSMRCGEIKNIQMHHEDYSKHLDIKCYCRFHHIMHHAKIKAERKRRSKYV